MPPRQWPCSRGCRSTSPCPQHPAAPQGRDMGSHVLPMPAGLSSASPGAVVPGPCLQQSSACPGHRCRPRRAGRAGFLPGRRAACLRRSGAPCSPAWPSGLRHGGNGWPGPREEAAPSRQPQPCRSPCPQRDVQADFNPASAPELPGTGSKHGGQGQRWRGLPGPFPSGTPHVVLGRVGAQPGGCIRGCQAPSLEQDQLSLPARHRLQASAAG